MRRFARTAFVVLAVLLAATAGIAQVYQTATPPPQVSAAGAPWQVNGDPILVFGDLYYPAAAASVFFDGNVMRRTGVYFDVPIYQDATIEPYSIVYVPIGRNLMRAYERRREGPLAGTAGSRTPSFPIQRDIEVSAAMQRAGHRLPVPVVSEPIGLGEQSLRTRRTAAAGPDTPIFAPVGRPAAAAASAGSHPATSMESILAPDGDTDGIWIMFDGSRWYLDGRAVSYEPGRFAQRSDYFGFTVYRDNTGGPERIYVTIVPDGPIAPFVRK